MEEIDLGKKKIEHLLQFVFECAENQTHFINTLSGHAHSFWSDLEIDLKGCY